MLKVRYKYYLTQICFICRYISRVPWENPSVPIPCKLFLPFLSYLPRMQSNKSKVTKKILADQGPELRKAASTTSALAERLEIPQEHSSLETKHNLSRNKIYNH